MRLLLVEDEHDIQAFLKQALADAGYQVDVAPDGKTAEALATSTAYDILIVDLGLPDGDGISLILRLRHSGVHVPVQRNSPTGGEATRLRVLDLELDLLRREATRSGQSLQLTPQEFVLLEYLCRNAGRVVTRSMILDKVWGMRIQPDTNVVDVHIYRLRGKVDGNGQQPLIRTLRGVGYVIKER